MFTAITPWCELVSEVMVITILMIMVMVVMMTAATF